LAPGLLEVAPAFEKAQSRRDRCSYARPFTRPLPLKVYYIREGLIKKGGDFPLLGLG
jgi:hypothetical protein